MDVVIVNVSGVVNLLPSPYLYMCVISRLSVEPKALVLMQRPTDADLTLILIFFPSFRFNQFTTSALTWKMCRGTINSSVQIFFVTRKQLYSNIPQTSWAPAHLGKNKWCIILLGQLSFLDGLNRSWSTTVNPWQDQTPKKQIRLIVFYHKRCLQNAKSSLTELPTLQHEDWSSGELHRIAFFCF